jgi:indolepyruvate ferredoxin oxidoreductase
MRRIERQLVVHYEATMTDIFESLTADSYDTAVAVASAPELVRGYEEVKMENLLKYAARLRQLGIDTAPLSI